MKYPNHDSNSVGESGTIAVGYSTREILRTPFYLKSGNSWLSAWLHTPTENRTFNHGIVIAAPIGYEHLHSYRGLRHLADQLAERDFPVLRFDWHGTGDSEGTDRDSDRLATWQQNLRDALSWMKEELGCHHLSVVGLRIGGSIAASVASMPSVNSTDTEASEIELENLVLWNPIPKGKAFVRELHTIDLTGDARPADLKSDDIEAGGFLLTAETAAELSKLNLLEMHPRCGRVLLVSNNESSGDVRLSDAWLKQGVDLSHAIHGGVPEMLDEPHRSHVAHKTLGAIADWLDQQVADRATLLSAPLSSRTQSFQAEDYKEQLVRFAPTFGLFGIVTEPQEPVPADRPTVLLLNAGATTRIGPGRLNVHLARRLAVEGYRSFRIDFQGLGDSVQPDHALENDSYAPTAFRDVQLAIDHLRKEFGVSRCVLAGLCSGAYAAFQSAAQVEDRAIVESLLINPLTFFWRDGMTIDDDPGRHLIKQHYYWHAMRDPKKWIRFLTGRSGTSFSKAARIVAKRIELVLRPRVSRSPSLQVKETCQAEYPTHPSRRDLSADLREVAGRGRHLAMFFSETDPGYMILNHYARKQAAALRKAGGLDLQFFSGADHTFSREEPRQRLISAIVDHLHRRYS